MKLFHLPFGNAAVQYKYCALRLKNNSSVKSIHCTVHISVVQCAYLANFDND
jgi:hypothetical protein